MKTAAISAHILMITMCVLAVFALRFAAIAQEQTQPAELSLEEKEEFLKKGKVISEKFTPVGVTHPMRITLEYKGMTHDAHVQSVDETSNSMQAGPEQRDYYGYNIAAYELDKLLGLNMTPPSVKRKYKGKPAAVTWWVDNVAMMNLDRVRNKIEPPSMDDWNRQIYIVRIINQLIYDSDPNMGNLLITKDWKLWTVDRTRAFCPFANLRNPDALSKCERHLFAALKELNKDKLNEKLGDYLTKTEIRCLDTRRQLIVKFFEEEIARKGEASVLYDFPAKN